MFKILSSYPVYCRHTDAILGSKDVLNANTYETFALANKLAGMEAEATQGEVYTRVVLANGSDLPRVDADPVVGHLRHAFLTLDARMPGKVHCRCSGIFLAWILPGAERANR